MPIVNAQSFLHVSFCCLILGLAACDGGGSSGGKPANKDNSQPVQTPQVSPPTQISAQIDNGAISASWIAVDGATAYKLYYATESFQNLKDLSKYKSLQNADVTELNTNQSEVNQVTENGKTYIKVNLPLRVIPAKYFYTPYYAVLTAVKDSEESVKSDEKSGTLALPAPTNVSATRIGTGGIQLGWDSITGASSYNVYYANESFAGKTESEYSNLQGYKTLSAITGAQTTLTNLSQGLTYYFVVSAQHQSNAKSEKSNQITLNLDRITPAQSTKLNDTGVTLCSDYAYGGSGKHNDDLTCPNQAGNDSDGDPIPFGQDGHYGTGKNGITGKKFTKVAGFEDKCVQDEHTRLMWEVKQTSAGLHYKDNTYSWYNTDSATNGGGEGVQNGGSCTGSACDTQALVLAVNAQGWCGHNDWRLPTRIEMQSIADFSKRTYAMLPRLDTRFFINSSHRKDALWWTSSPRAFAKTIAQVFTSRGGSGFAPKKSALRVRLVRTHSN